MKVAAVIAEFNPFHNGHLHLINNIKQELNNDYTIVIMSGDYVERGEPAAYPKELRAKWAIEAGADLVLLLPLPYATGSADLFAYGAVSILNKLNIVDYLCFGCECNDFERLKKASLAVSEKGTVESKEIKDLMKTGLTFPKARAYVLKEFDDILEGSNNILAIEYLNALRASNSSIMPYAIKRVGENYTSNNVNTESFASAQGIRNAIISKNTDAIKSQVPLYVYEDMVVSNIPYNKLNLPKKIISPNDFSNELFYSLLLKKELLTDYLDVSKDLSNKISKDLLAFDNFIDFVEKLKSKDLTYARISRSLLHIMLNVKHDKEYYVNGFDRLNHVKALAINKQSTPILNNIKDNKGINIISRLKDSYTDFNEFEKELYDTEIFASDLYSKKASTEINELKKQVTVL